MAVSCARYDIVGTPGAFKLAVADDAHHQRERRWVPAELRPPADTPVFSCLPTGMLRQATGAYGAWIGSCAHHRRERAAVRLHESNAPVALAARAGGRETVL